MLKIFNQNKSPLGYISKIKDVTIESDLENSDKTLSFTYCVRKGGKKILNEFYVETETDRYVVKEVSESSDGYPTFNCELDLEDLEQNMFLDFTHENTTVLDVARLAVAGTGWRVESDVTRIRTVQQQKVNSLTILKAIRDAFFCEMKLDTKNKVVYFYNEIGEDRGVYLMSGLNLKKLSATTDSRDYYTRLIPIGKDDLRIEGGYVENHQYSNKIRELIWEDTTYEDAEELKADAIKKLQDISKPRTSYSVTINDLAKQYGKYPKYYADEQLNILIDGDGGAFIDADESYLHNLLSFSLGDKVTLIDINTGTRDKQRIVKITEHPDNPENNTAEIANTFYHYHEKQEAIQRAMENYESISDSSGAVKSGVYIHGTMDGSKVAVEVGDYSTGGSLTDLNSYAASVNNQINGVQENLDDIKARVGSLDVTYLKATEADIKYATIDLANIKEGCIKSAMIDTGAVNTAQIADGSITDAKIVDLTANKITAGTLSVERLEVRGTQNSIVYAINNISGALQAQNVDTINGETLTERTITADKIVANAITASEIASRTITANEIVAGTITSNEIKANSIVAESIASGAITADKIDVNDLFAQDITATGTISGVTLSGATGSFSGTVNASEFKINDNKLGFGSANLTMQSVDDAWVEFGTGDVSGDRVYYFLGSATTIEARDCLILEAEQGLHVPGMADFGTLGAKVAYIQDLQVGAKARFATTIKANDIVVNKDISLTGVNSELKNKLDKSGGTITGSLTVTGQWDSETELKVTGKVISDAWVSRVYGGGIYRSDSTYVRTDETFYAPTIHYTAIKNISDERTKNILGSVDERFEKAFMELKPITYTFKNDKSGAKRIGLGAQTTESVFAENGINIAEYGIIQHTYFDTEVDGMADRYTIDYQDVSMLATWMTQKNARRIEKLEAEVSALQKKNEELRIFLSERSV